MTDRMMQLDTDNAAAYQQTLLDFRQRWNIAIEAWEERDQTEDERAIERVNELLKGHVKKELPSDVEKEIDKIRCLKPLG